MTRLSTALRLGAAVRAAVTLVLMTGCAAVPDGDPRPSKVRIPFSDVTPREVGEAVGARDPPPPQMGNLPAVSQAGRPAAPPASGEPGEVLEGAAAVTAGGASTPRPAATERTPAAAFGKAEDDAPVAPRPDLAARITAPRPVIRGTYPAAGLGAARPPLAMRPSGEIAPTRPRPASVGSRRHLTTLNGVPRVDGSSADGEDHTGRDDELPGPGTNADLIVQITEANRVVPPGGMMNVQYLLYSAEGNPGRVRLRVDAPEGWNLLDGAGDERPLEAWEIIDEELRITVPAETPAGETHVLRLIAELVGEPGVSEALTPVQILNGGALKEGDKYLAGTTTLGVSGSPVQIQELDGGDVAGTVNLSGKLAEKTSVAIAFRKGPQESLTNYRYRLDETYLRAGVQHAGWQLKLGSRISSQGSPLTGPSVSGNGLLLTKMSGRVFGEAVMAQPTTFLGAAAGHLWRATMGVRFSIGTIGVSVSDFARPDGGYSTLAPELDPTLDPDSLEVLERERALSTGTTSTRVRGFGVEANLRMARAHRLLLRVGGLGLSAGGGAELGRSSLEAQYSFSAKRAFLNTRFRRMPPAVQGIYLPGNEVSVDGNLLLIGPLRVMTRAYRYENETLGEATGFTVNGGSVGLGLASNRWRLDVRGQHRTLDYSDRTVRRTGQVGLGLSWGSWSIGTASEVGTEETGDSGSHPFRSHRGDLRVKGDPGYASFAVRTYESGGLGSRLRADLLGSATFGGFEVAGGAWATRGWTLGGEPGAWMHLGVPLYYQFTALVGLERWAREGSPWRVSFGLRKGLVLPIPFTGADTGAPPAWSGSETAGSREANTSRAGVQ